MRPYLRQKTLEFQSVYTRIVIRNSEEISTRGIGANATNAKNHCKLSWSSMNYRKFLELQHLAIGFGTHKVVLPIGQSPSESP